MTCLRLCLLLLLCSLATVPWAIPGASASLAGLPLWAVYSLTASAAFAGITAYLVHRYWSLAAGEERTDA